MTKKHFIALADYLRDSGPYCEPFTDRQIEHLANFCHAQNFRFDKGIFVGYIKGECGPAGGAVKKSKAA